MIISSIKAMEVLDSRGNPTVSAEVTLKNGIKGVAIVPSGASTGKFEAHELRDMDKRFLGKGVMKAVENVNNIIAPEICAMNTLNQRRIDNAMITIDSTENKSNLGANAMLAVSLATARAAARYFGVPLYRYIGGINPNIMPKPMMNIINGGAHSGNNLDIQEFMIVPSMPDFCERVRAGAEIYHALGKILKKQGHDTGIGDEGGFAPHLKNDQEAIEYIIEAICVAGYSTDNVKIALDVASSEWAMGGEYKLSKSKETLSSEALQKRIENLINKYPIISVEDGLGEEDYKGWQNLTSRIGNRVMLVGDDLFVTNKNRLTMGIKENLGNAILIKLNQIGTLTETLDVISLAKKNGYQHIVSHRSGETEDTFIADLCVATGAEFIKSGAPCRTDRVAKYNRLLKISQEICKR